MSITDSEPITVLSLTKIILKFDDKQNPRRHTPKKTGQEQVGKVQLELQVSHSLSGDPAPQKVLQDVVVFVPGEAAFQGNSFQWPSSSLESFHRFQATGLMPKSSKAYN